MTHNSKAKLWGHKILFPQKSTVVNYRFFRASNRRVNASKSSSGGALYTGGGVGTLPAAAGFPFSSASSSVGGISGSFGVLRPVNVPDVSEAFGPDSDSELPPFCSVNS
jgi:hypothetical protein